MSKIDMGGYRFPYNLTRRWLNPRHIKREVRRFIQRGINGYDETSHWSLDYEVAELLINVMPRLKNSGIPMFYYNEVCNKKERPDFDRTWKTTKRMEKAARELRDSEIDAIVDGLRKYQEDDWSNHGSEAMELFAKRFGSWWD